MHHVELEHWSRRASPVHRRDPRAKLGVLLVFLVAVATTTHALVPAGAWWLLILGGAILVARLPLRGVVLRACLVLPFSAVFAAITWLAGDPARAFAMVSKSYLSALAVLVVVGTTPLPELLRGLEGMGVPRFLVMVAQFLYRYLFVISEEAQHMRTAAVARGASAWGWLRRGERFQAAGGAVAVLFARSHERAEEIHRAMLSRGFAGQFHAVCRLRFGWKDAAFAAAASLLALAPRIGEAVWCA